MRAQLIGSDTIYFVRTTNRTLVCEGEESDKVGALDDDNDDEHGNKQQSTMEQIKAYGAARTNLGISPLNKI